MTKTATLIFSLFLLGVSSYLQADKMEDYLITQIQLISERIEYFKANCIESGLDVQTLYYMEGEKTEAAIILAKYRELCSCGEISPSS